MGGGIWNGKGYLEWEVLSGMGGGIWEKIHCYEQKQCSLEKQLMEFINISGVQGYKKTKSVWAWRPQGETACKKHVILRQNLGGINLH